MPDSVSAKDARTDIGVLGNEYPINPRHSAAWHRELDPKGAGPFHDFHRPRHFKLQVARPGNRNTPAPLRPGHVDDSEAHEQCSAYSVGHFGKREDGKENVEMERLLLHASRAFYACFKDSYFA